jgi:hypothetical protein
MRTLLVQYTTATTEEAILKDSPFFHLAKQVTDQEILNAFFGAFSYESFGIQGGCHVPIDTGTLRPVQEALRQFLALREAASESALASTNACRAKLNAAAKSATRQSQLELNPKDKATDNVLY